jgi:hypothetical protein
MFWKKNMANDNLFIKLHVQLRIECNLVKFYWRVKTFFTRSTLCMGELHMKKMYFRQRFLQHYKL